MENRTAKNFYDSLDLTHDRLNSYLPQLFEGLWELGSMPQYIIDLIERNHIRAQGSQVLDLGCGKGSVLINLAMNYDVQGTGMDVVPEFIEEAQAYAKTYGVEDKLNFRTENLLETIHKTSSQDMVIYGYDSEILGDLATTINYLSGCIKDNRVMVIEFIVALRPTEGMLTDQAMMDTLKECPYTMLDRIDWDVETLRQVNQKNIRIIARNIQQLTLQYPNMKKIFMDYLENQKTECSYMENDCTCTTILLGAGRDG